MDGGKKVCVVSTGQWAQWSQCQCGQWSQQYAVCCCGLDVHSLHSTQLSLPPPLDWRRESMRLTVIRSTARARACAVPVSSSLQQQSR